MRPAILACASLACLGAFGQENRPQINEPQVDPIAAVRSVLGELSKGTPVTCKTNDALAFCTIHCHDLPERDAVYDRFRNVPKYSMSATREPPAVCVVLVFDPSKYQSQQYGIAMRANMASSMASIRGKVIQRTDEGLLVSVPGNNGTSRSVFVTDGPDLIDDDPISVTAYWIGRHQYLAVNNSRRTVDKYTCDERAAAEFWKPVSEKKAEVETKKRVGQP